MIKLNLACASNIKDGYINIDLHPEDYPGLPIIAANALALPFRDRSIDEIYMSHFLEHLDYMEADLGIREWRRVLKIGGKIKLIVPDMEVIAKGWLNEESIHRKMFFWRGAIYGSFRGQEQYHKSAWDKIMLENFLRHFKFRDIVLSYDTEWNFWLIAEGVR